MTGDREPIRSTDLSEASFIRLADAHRSEGLIEDAIRICREGLARFPSSLRARILLGQSLLDQGAIGEAIVELGRVEREARDDPEVLALLRDVRTAGPQWARRGAELRDAAATPPAAPTGATVTEPPVLFLDAFGRPADAAPGPDASGVDPLASPTLAGLYADQGDQAAADAIRRQIAPEEATPSAEAVASPEPARYLEELQRLREVAARLRKTQAR